MVYTLEPHVQKEIEKKIKAGYLHVPYHGFPHALGVSRRVERLLGKKDLALKFASLGHDIDHGWRKRPDDEEISTRLTVDILRENISGIEKTGLIEGVQELIPATKFKKRTEIWQSGTEKQRILCDADLGKLGAQFPVFLRSCMRTFLEEEIGPERKAGIIIDKNGEKPVEKVDTDLLVQDVEKWRKWQLGFFDHLRTITGSDNPFISEQGRALYGPQYIVNQDKTRTISPEKVGKILLEEQARFWGKTN